MNIIYMYLTKIELKDVCMIEIQILERIEYFHSKHVIYRYINQTNFVIGKKILH